MNRALMSSGELARTAGVNVKTLRFYERRGLLMEPGRTSSGHRRYGSETLERLQLIRRAQALGFSLPEIKLELPRFGGRVRTAVDRRLRGARFRLASPRPWTHAGA